MKITIRPSKDKYKENGVKPHHDEQKSPWSSGKGCEICHDKDAFGKLYPCDSCPRVYHSICYFPILIRKPPEDWTCLLCITREDIKSVPNVPKKGPFGSGKLGEREQVIGRRLLLEIYKCWPESKTFWLIKDLDFTQYRMHIRKPIAMDVIKSRLDSDSKDQYRTLQGFVDDIRRMFANCRQFWDISRKNGKKITVGRTYIKHADKVEQHFNTHLREWKKIQCLPYEPQQNINPKHARKGELVEKEIIVKHNGIPIGKQKIYVANNSDSSSSGQKRKREDSFIDDKSEDDDEDKVYDEDVWRNYDKEEINVENILKKIRREKKDSDIDEDYSPNDKERKVHGIQKEKKKTIPLALLYPDNTNIKSSSETLAEKDMKKCKYCEARFSNQIGLENHSLNHFEDKIWPLMPTKRPFKCPNSLECSEEFQDKITLMRHFAFSHYIDDEDISSDNLSKKSRYKVVGNNKQQNDKMDSDNDNDEDYSPNDKERKKHGIQKEKKKTIPLELLYPDNTDNTSNSNNEAINDSKISKDINGNEILEVKDDIANQTMKLFSSDPFSDLGKEKKLKIMTVDRINARDAENIRDAEKSKVLSMADNIMNSDLSNGEEIEISSS